MRIAAQDSRIAPSDNVWDVPLLDVTLQPTALVAPFLAWGSVARTTRHGGTWHFYVDDERFATRNLAEQVIATEPASVVEPNYSIFDWTPRAEALWAIYRKRRFAWEMQTRQLGVFVDLCVPSHMHELALLGVPQGWRAYATRGFDSRADDVLGEYRTATDRAGGTPLFVVYGGGKKVRERMAGLPGAVHVAGFMNERAALLGQGQR